MKVTEYFLGFGPRLWSIRRGETEYGIKAIPAGGYVRIVGMTMLEEVDPSDEARSYRQASFPRRLLVALAGSGDARDPRVRAVVLAVHDRGGTRLRRRRRSRASGSSPEASARHSAPA